ncbi:hypothetical protein [Actinomadura parmotrematis]|uniref:Uncharacterized protein n=1 Tax=Actinomadura parmotrematis TaxID=2864039 RepID=A0ABS7FYJ1_9ACTN|nr:hypothetical protein [Actinomadura parmotrematis]MBW8484719.1 hypothetical protein [Actinomadura parmotrematis]
MRLVILIVAVLLVAVVAVLAVYAARGAAAPAPAARWEIATESRDGVTTVAVRQVAGDRETGRQAIAAIPDDSADWESAYHEAMARARSRLAALNSQQDP